MSAETAKTLTPQKSRIISKVLSPAIRLWLRSQVEHVEDLQFQIRGGDRQILKGHIPSVFISASYAVYQGLRLSQIQLEGTDIRVNLGQMLKGKPLRLLEPVPVEAQLLITESDLHASLQAPLLSTAVIDFLSTLLQSHGTIDAIDNFKQREIAWEKIDIEMGQLTLLGSQTDANRETTPIAIRAGLQLVSPRELRLSPFQVQIHPDQPPLTLDDIQIDLGSEVQLQHLALTPGQLMCRGRLSVVPGE